MFGTKATHLAKLS